MHPGAKLLAVVNHAMATGGLPPSMTKALEVTLQNLQNPRAFGRGFDLAEWILDLYTEHVDRKDHFTHDEFVMALGILLVGATIAALDPDALAREEGGVKSEK